MAPAIQNTSPLEAIEQLLAIQVNATEDRQQATRLHFANLPAPWTIDDYGFSASPGVEEALIRELATLRFLDDIGKSGYLNLRSSPLLAARAIVCP